MTAAALALAVALLVWAPRADRRRSGFLRSPRGRRPAVRHPAASTPRTRLLLAGGAALAVGLLIGGGMGLLRKAVPGGQDATRTALLGDLPAACDLIAVCLAAGVPVPGALAAVGEAAPEPLGGHLRRVAALYRLGADGRRAWDGVPRELAGLGRALVRAGESGAAVVPALRSLAADSRAARRLATETAVRRAGVWVLAPLGLCFLPAFVCLGVVPLILGIAGDVFH